MMLLGFCVIYLYIDALGDLRKGEASLAVLHLVRSVSCHTLLHTQPKTYC